MMKITNRLKRLVAIVFFYAMTVPIMAATQVIDNTPPISVGGGDPNVILALSVEYPTAGVAYPSGWDINQKYIGYFDPNKCYQYNSGGYFEPKSPVEDASLRTCKSSYWSGNLLNWATMSAIDIFRATLTGGNRAKGTGTTATDYSSGDSQKETYLRRANVTSNLQNKTYGFGDGAKSIQSNISSLTEFSGDGTPISVSFSSSGFTFTAKYTNKNKSYNQTKTYNAIVKVCTAISGLPNNGLEDNCKLYGSTTYKPKGLIQDNATKMRFGVFSYLNDPDYNRDGGVLRARLKYPGSVGSATTTKATYDLGVEWDSDGVFYTNPDTVDALGTHSDVTNSVLNSGVVNAINKFGDYKGYKTYDPAAELYYAALRYYRNKGNYSQYTKKVTLDIQDNFPVITDWDDPINNVCSKNFIIYIGDTNTHGDVDLPGSSWIPSGNQQNPKLIPTDDSEFDVSKFTQAIGDYEGISNFVAINSGSTNSPPYIAGLAYWAHTNNLRPEKSTTTKTTVNAFMIDVVEGGNPKVPKPPNPNPNNLKPNPFYWAAKYGGFTDSNNNQRPDLNSEWQGATSITWSDGTTSLAPSNFAQANNPVNMVTALNNAFASVSLAGSITLATPTANAAAVRPDGSTNEYISSFKTTDWSGDVKAFAINSSGTVSATASWSASDKLEQSLGSTAPSRNVYTTISGAGLAFNSTNAASIKLDSSMINYIRGDKSNEGTQYRTRVTRLGDIINSSPTYIPALGASPSDCSFNTNNVARNPMLAVGANDGMLHLFDATTGAEVFSYIPGNVLGNLSQLSSKNYTHQYYVDGTPVAANICYPKGSTTETRTVLVGSTGAGGSAIYALDVTQPSSFGASNVLWEFSASDDSAMGTAVPQPQIVKIRNGVDSNNHPKYQYAVITGNGLNNASSTGASLFILPLSHTGAWSSGQYKRLDVGNGPAGTNNTITPNGLMSPQAVDVDQDGVTDYIYAGDINGNLWKFDLTATNPSSWSAPTTPFFRAYSVSGSPLANSKQQPITEAPLVIKHPNGGIFLLFGTGKLYSTTDKADTSSQYLYGIRDKLDGSTLGQTANASLVAQSLGSSVATIYQQTASNTVDYSTSNGWYLPLSSGERSLVTPTVVQGRIQFTTTVPASDPCTPGSDSWLTEISPFSGAQLAYAVFDTNGDGVVDSSDSLASRRKIAGVSGGTLNLSTSNFSILRLQSGGIGPNRFPRKVSWREIMNQ